MVEELVMVSGRVVRYIIYHARDNDDGKDHFASDDLGDVDEEKGSNVGATVYCGFFTLDSPRSECCKQMLKCSAKSDLIHTAL
eukprot:765967-Hanusia_phi.AAC.2